MKLSHQQRIITSIMVAICVVLIVVAIFSGGGPSVLKDLDDTSLFSPRWPDGQTAIIPPAVKSYACPQCSTEIAWGSEACLLCGWCPSRVMHRSALPGTRTGGSRTNTYQTGATVPAASLASPREQNAAGKELIEGHWLGLEVIQLTPELAREYRISKGETGVLVDEITLEAAESGILAGDIIQSIDNRPTPDLRAFFHATQHVQEQTKASIGISRQGNKIAYIIKARNTKELGWSQMEAAQPIQPGAISPHSYRGRPCTDCHIIMQTGGQLATDAGDILRNPPVITRNARAPHSYRGNCSTCHIIK